MKCPECGTEMVERRVTSEEKILKKALKLKRPVKVEFIELTCLNCGARYVDTKSLDEAWRKVMEG